MNTRNIIDKMNRDTTTLYYKKNDLLPFQYCGEGYIVLNPEKKAIHELQGTAAFLFRYFIKDNGKSVTYLGLYDLLIPLCAHYEVELEEAIFDISNFLAQLQKLGILETLSHTIISSEQTLEAY